MLNSKSVTLSDFSWRVRRDADSTEEYKNLKPLANLFRPGKVLTWEGDASGTHSVDITKYFETEANSPNLPKSVFPDLDSAVKIGVLNYRSSFFDPSEYYFEAYINIDNSLDTKITASIEFDEGDRSFYQLQSSGQVTIENHQMKIDLKRGRPRETPIGGRVARSSKIVCTDTECGAEAL